MLKPGEVIGILGGGQLGRMLSQKAAQLGLRCHVYCPETDPPAAEVAWRHTQAAYDDEAALEAFAKTIHVATFEFENVPAAALSVLGRQRRIAPNATALGIAQDRLDEKQFAHQHGIATAPFVAVDAPCAPASVPDDLFPAILKTRRFGYDGKGQCAVNHAEDLPEAHESLAQAPAILEKKINFAGEMSAIIARATSGETACYAPIWNEHRNHILHRSSVPAPVPQAVQENAKAIAVNLAHALDYVGVLAIELFLTEENELLFNEMAPRVHNSGHWTLEGAVTCQFQQHIRAVADLPLGAPDLIAPSEMINLIGDDAEAPYRLLQDPNTHLHLYSKSEIREGRKMGHYTRVSY